MDEKTAKDGHLVHSFKIADGTGSATLTLWDRVGADVDEGDILLVLGGFVTMYQNEIRLACRIGLVMRQGRFTMTFAEAPDHSAFAWVPDGEDPGRLIKQNPEATKPSRPPFKKGLHQPRARPSPDRRDPRLASGPPPRPSPRSPKGVKRKAPALPEPHTRSPREQP